MTNKSMHHEQTPKLSVIVLSYNGMEHLAECLSSIFSQSHTDFELIIIDNASHDGSPDWIENHYPDIKLIRSKTNIGFCRGMNLGVSMSRGSFVLLLNQDIKLDPDCMAELLKELESRSTTWIGAFPKVLFYHAPMFINAYGVKWYETCHWRDTRVGMVDLDQFKQPEQVFGSIFPAVMFRKDKFEEIGGFDNLFWSYNEDFDICYRAGIFGYKFIAIPKAVVRHKYRASSKDQSNPLWSKYWFIRNYFLVFLKNYQLSNLWKYKRIIFLRYMGMSYLNAMRSRHFKEIFVYLRVILSLIYRIPWILKRRYFIQLHRKIQDRDIWSYGNIEEHNIYHYNGAVVLSLKSMHAAVRSEKYNYLIGGKEYSSI